MMSRRTFASALAAGATGVLLPRLVRAQNGPGARNIVLVHRPLTHWPPTRRTSAASPSAAITIPDPCGDHAPRRTTAAFRRCHVRHQGAKQGWTRDGRMLRLSGGCAGCRDRNVCRYRHGIDHTDDALAGSVPYQSQLTGPRKSRLPTGTPRWRSMS
jgi:hypothetical protein